MTDTDFIPSEFYNSEELAKKLDVTLDWLKANRKRGKPAIPYKKIGPLVRYNRQDVLSWVGRKDLELEFYSPETLAKKLNLSLSWINHNRLSSNPIPFRRFGRIIRYNKTEVHYWLNKQTKQ